MTKRIFETRKELEVVYPKMKNYSYIDVFYEGSYEISADENDIITFKELPFDDSDFQKMVSELYAPTKINGKTGEIVQ